MAPDALAIAGPALTLRLPEPADAPALFELGRDPEVTRFFSWGPYRAVGEAEAWIATLPGRRERGEGLELLVVGPGNEVAGVTGLTEMAPRDRRATIGSWLGRRFWGTGVNLEAKALLARLAFEVLGLERLSAYASTGNPRSQAALERVGFEREGVLRGWHRHGDRVHDVVLFALLRAEWAGGPLAAVPGEVSGAPPGAFLVAGLPAATGPDPGAATGPDAGATGAAAPR